MSSMVDRPLLDMRTGCQTWNRLRMDRAADSFAMLVPWSMQHAARDHGRRCVYPLMRRRPAWEPARLALKMVEWIRPAVHFCAARGWGCRRPTSWVKVGHQRRDLSLARFGIRFWLSSPHLHGSTPHRKSGAVSDVRAKTHGEPKSANTAMRCGSRVLKTGDEELWPGIGCRPDQLRCLDAFSRKAGVIADASQSQLHCEGVATGAASKGAPKTDSGSATAGAGHDCDAFSFPRWEQGKEPFEPLQLTPAGRLRQALSGVYEWRRKVPVRRVYRPVPQESKAACGLAGCKSGLWFPS